MSTPTQLLAHAKGRTRLWLLLAPVLLFSCAAPKSATGPARANLVDIQGSVAPLAAWFDRERETPRAILLLSPV